MRAAQDARIGNLRGPPAFAPVILLGVALWLWNRFILHFMRIASPTEITFCIKSTPVDVSLVLFAANHNV